MSMIKVLVDTSPLQSGHAHRGVGMYTKYLLAGLQQRRDVEVVETAPAVPGDATPAAADIIHYPFFDFFFATLPWRRVAPTVITIHDVIPLLFPNYYRPGIKGRLRWWRQRWLAQRVAAIITDSESSKMDIIKHLGAKMSNVFVVPLAANPDIKPMRRDKAEQLTSELQLPKKYVLYVGDINYNKNIPQLVKMLKFLPNVQLVCVGKHFTPQPIPEWRWIEAQIAASNVADRVHFITTIEPDRTDILSAVYSLAEAYIQPSLYEGFGLPVLEAMQARVPVVTTQNSSLREVAGEHAVFVESSAEALAAGVRQVLEWSESHRADVVRAAFAWSQKYTWQQTTAKTVAVYKKCLEAKK